VHSDPAVLLRSHGLNVTAQRLAVLRAVALHPHGSAETVAEAVRADIGAVSQQAVYDALGLLTEKGVLRRIQPAGSPALFDPRVGDTHHHAICRACGAVADVDCAPGQKPNLTAAAQSGFLIDEAEVLYWGVCPSCRAAAAVPTRP
jgi:Fe2+ or Zn2+ uptake regulation protein